MGASAYAGLLSLLNTMDQIQIHPRLSTCFDTSQFESLRKVVDVLVDFVVHYSNADSEEAQNLMRPIADVAHEAEDIIEVQAADLIHAGSTREGPTLLNLQRHIQEMISIKEMVINVKEENGFINSIAPPPPPPSSSSAAAAAAPPATRKTSMVGFERYVAKLLDELTGHHSGRRILPIVGMGGIGKTTLARNVYDNIVMVHHFDVRAWVTVSQEYNANDIVLQALSCLGGSKSTADDEVGEELYKTLSGRRYLIVLDDVWHVEDWEKIQFFFPQNDNRSRIDVTTRQQEVVDYFGSSALAVDFLDDKNSWELFCEETFSQQGCPPQLEVVGRKMGESTKLALYQKELEILAPYLEIWK